MQSIEKEGGAEGGVVADEAEEAEEAEEVPPKAKTPELWMQQRC